MLHSQETLGVYISVPFCASKCSYCNFASGVFTRDRMAPYVDRLLQEVRASRARAAALGAILPQTVSSIYFGGGTPSLLPPDLFAQIAAALQDEFEFSGQLEWTIECAPGQLTEATLHAMCEAGVDRLSFGVQSFVNKECAAVGRLHGKADTLATIERARRAGIANINIDLLAGLPHQTHSSWRESLDTAIALDTPHVSVYMLEVDEDSRLGRELLAGKNRYHAQSVPSDDAIADFYEMAWDALNSAGIQQYEISNFALRGHESRHNLRYWQRGPYIGFGLDAHSCLRKQNGDMVRFANPDDLNACMLGASGSVTLVDHEKQLEEAWFLGLRMNRGVNAAELRNTFGSAALEKQHAADALVHDGLLERDGEIYRLTSRGRMLSNEVFERFVAVEETTCV